MKDLLKYGLAALLTMLSVVTANAEEKITSPVEDYVHEGPQYPPVLFVTNIESPSFEEKLNGFNAFSNLDKEAVGLPIGIRILKGHRTKADGAQVSSVILSASTLGLIPIVSNTEFKVRYDVFVQGQTLATYTYQVDSTEIENLWSGPKGFDRENKPSEDLFMEATLSKFLNELKSSEEAQKVFSEYWQYFPNS